MNHQEREQGPLPALTGARFFAAFAVVVSHYGKEPLAHIAPALAALAASGPIAVSFFYVLSGAVLTWGCTGGGGFPARPTRLFWAQRAARLLPAYALALALSFLPFASHVMKLHPGAGGALRIGGGLAASLLLVQAFLIPITAGLNTPAWSISCEAFFYLNWPRLSVWLRSEQRGFPWRSAVLFWLIGLVAPLLAIALIGAGAMPLGPFATLFEDVSGGELLARTVTYFPPLRLPEFVLGIAVGHALRRTPAVEGSAATDTLREGMLVSLLLASSWAFGSGLPARITGVTLASRIFVESGTASLLFALLVWQLARGGGLLRRVLSEPRLLVLGEASYALYVLQEPAYVWLTAVLKRLHREAVTQTGAFFVIYAVLVIALSVLVQRKWETPLRKALLRRWTERRVDVAGRSSPPP